MNNFLIDFITVVVYNLIMKKVTMKEFKDKSNMDVILELAKVNNNYVTSKLISELGIHRMYLKMLEDKCLISRVGVGVYILSSKLSLVDEMYVYSLCNPKVIFSHLTALSLYGLFNKKLDKYYISVPNKYHNIKNNVHHVYYITDKYYDIGKIKFKTPLGNLVNVYDVEKSICDIIKFKFDECDIISILKKYKLKFNNYDKLLHFADLMNVKDKVIEYYNKAL